MLKNNILFEIIITNQCNKRCKYCNLDFKNTFISDEYIKKFILFIKDNSYCFNNIKINFFWWEPLLWKNIIKAIILDLKYIKNIEFSLWTNGILLDEDFLNFWKEYNLTYFISIDTDSDNKLFEKEYIKKYTNFININFIINPNSIYNFYHLYKYVLDFWFENINIMPVFSTVKWTRDSFIELKKINNYLNTNLAENISVNKFSYFNWISIDKQFILDTNWNLYQDLDSLLWIQKQDKSIDIKLYNEIEKLTLIWNISYINIDFLLKYSLRTIKNLVFKIPKSQWLLLDYKIIDRIFNKNNLW